MNGAGKLNIILLGHAVLIPAHIGDDNGVAGQKLFHIPQNALGCHGEAAVIADGLVLLFKASLLPCDGRPQLRIAAALGAQQLHLSQKLL